MEGTVIVRNVLSIPVRDLSSAGFVVQERRIQHKPGTVDDILFLHSNEKYWLTNNVHIKRPTTGLLMYTMATRFCDEIHLYGFWPFPRNSEGKLVKYHYYDALTYQYTSSSSPHTMPLEFRTLSMLHRQGALRLHTGTCKPPT